MSSRLLQETGAPLLLETRGYMLLNASAISVAATVIVTQRAESYAAVTQIASVTTPVTQRVDAQVTL